MIGSASATPAPTRDLAGQARRTVLGVELVPYVREGDSSDKFLICQPELRCCRQLWTRKVSQGMVVDVVESSRKRPG